MFTEGEPEFDPLQDLTILSMLMSIDRRFMGKCLGDLQAQGVYPGQIPVLGLLACREGLSQKEIAEKLGIKPPTVNVSVRRLEKTGLLFRRADEKDQRISRNYLTEKGHQAKENGMRKIKENEKILLEGFSDAELCLLKRFLRQLMNNIDRIPGKNNSRKERQKN